jgi:hypothetical protein
MAHATLKLAPGVDQNKTPTLNEAAFTDTNLVRFMPDKGGLGLVQKLGGWSKFYPSGFGTPIRALWAWDDTNGQSRLAVGAQSEIVKITSLKGDGTYVTLEYEGPRFFTTGSLVTVTGFVPEGYNGVFTILSSVTGQLVYFCEETANITQYGEIQTGDALFLINNQVRSIITPSVSQSEAGVAVSTTAGSPVCIIEDPKASLLTGDVVYIKTQISVGGIVLFGTYKAKYVSATEYSISASNILGAPQPATTGVARGGVLPVFNYQTGSSFVVVDLPDHGLSDGSTFTILTPVYNGSLKLYGNYTASVDGGVDGPNQFTINAANLYTGDGQPSVIMNGNKAFYEYYKTPGPLPTGTGYGIGGYGMGLYGVGEPAEPGAPGQYGTPIAAKDWTLDNWGEILMSCPVGGPIFKWSPDLGSTQALIIPNAPPANDGMFVAMPQRQIVAWGSTFGGIQDPLLIRWCDVADYDAWVATVTNQAGSYRFSKGSKIVGGIQGPQQGLIWTDLAIWAMQYAGPPLVYSFTEIGTGCGLVGRKAAGSLNGVVYWMGQSQFFMLGGGQGVTVIPCPIWDVVFQDFDISNADKIRFAANSNFSEVQWFYPTKSSGGEVSHYVKYNTILNAWDYGTLARTAWINQSVFGPPIGAGLDKFIYQHETSLDADGLAMPTWFQTGYFQISEGEYKIFIDQVWPDFKWGLYNGAQDADLSLTFYVTDYPGDTPRRYGPYPMNKTTEFLTPRFRGRLVSIKIEGADTASFWRIGALRYRFTQDGKF